jgi:DNA-binding winged helix-turn-helix (wHTH) protein/predicted ATPase
MRQGKLYTFQEFVLDVDDASLRQGQEQRPLRPKAFNMLCYFVERPGQLVTKDELFHALWPNIVVDGATLTGCIRELRTVLNDDAKQPRFIETVPTRGYRFIGKVVSSQHSVVSREEGVRDLGLGVSFSSPQASSLQSQASNFVGRDAELAALQQWLAKAQRGERQVVFVTGEPGIGKTTLVEAFLQSLESSVQSLASERVQGPKSRVQVLNQPLAPVFIGRGQCVKQYGSGEAYLPMFEALTRLGREAHGEQLIAVLQQYAPTWVAQIPGFLSLRDVDALQPRVAGTTRERMLREFAEAVEVFTRERVLVLWFDDLHDSDPSTLDLIAYLARRQQSARLLLIGTYRPAEILSGEHALKHIQRELRERRRWQELPLACLNEPTVEDYLKVHFPGATTFSFPTLARAVYRRTEGNPLFLVSMLDDLKAQRVLVQSEGCWHLQANLHEVVSRVPATLQATLEGQLHDLRPEEQEVVEAASVAGMAFAVPLVSAATGKSLLEAEEICENLARRERFICREGMEEWPDRTFATRYRFRHVLHQDVAYQRIPPVKRSDWHQKIGERREQAFAAELGTIAVELAARFERSHDYRRAVRYLQQAGEQAIQRNAYREAISLLTKGLELLQTLPETPERNRHELSLQVALGLALTAAKGYGTPDVGRAYDRARELCRQLAEAPELFVVLPGLFRFYVVREEFPTARELAEQCLTLAQRVHEPTFLIEAHQAVGMTTFHYGELAAAREHFEQSLALYDSRRYGSSGSPHDLGVNGHYYGAYGLWFLGYPDQALRSIRQALTLAHELSHPFSLAGALYFTAMLHHLYREEHETQARAEELIALSREQGFPQWLALGGIMRGQALAVQGQGEAGIAQIRQGLAAYEAVGAKLGLPYLLGVLAEAYGKAEQPAEGLKVVAEALAVAQNTGDCFFEAELYRLKGELLLKNSGARIQKSEASTQSPTLNTQHLTLNTHAKVEAEECFLKAIEIARRQQAKSLELRAVVSLSRLWQHQGKKAEARQMLSKLYGWFTEGFETTALQEAKALLDALA